MDDTSKVTKMDGEVVREVSACDDRTSHINEQSDDMCTCPFCGRSFPSGKEHHQNPSTDRNQCHCLKCGYTWRSINKGPTRCPRCRSKAWSRPDLLCHCYKCGHEWTTRKEKIPNRCPKCRTVRWNDPAMATKRVKVVEPSPPKFTIESSDPLTMDDIVRLSADNGVATITLMKQALKKGALRMKR